MYYGFFVRSKYPSPNDLLARCECSLIEQPEGSTNHRSTKCHWKLCRFGVFSWTRISTGENGEEQRSLGFEHPDHDFPQSIYFKNKLSVFCFDRWTYKNQHLRHHGQSRAEFGKGITQQRTQLG